MKSRIPFYLILLALIILGALSMWYRHITFQIPWVPGEKRQIWSVEAKVEFAAEGLPVKVSLAIPDTQPSFIRLNEHTASPGYGLSYLENAQGRRAEWSIREAYGKQTLYYRVDMLVDNGSVPVVSPPAPELAVPSHTEPYATAAYELLERAQQRSADAFSLARELIKEFNSQSQTAQLLAQVQTRSRWLVDLLNLADVSAREVQMLALEDGRRRQPLRTFLQVYQGKEYYLFNPENGIDEPLGQQLLWEYYSSPLLDLVGGTGSKVSFSIIKQDVPLRRMLADRPLQQDALLDFSIHSLPLEEQTMFKGILLIPVGVLVVVLLRILVGLKTSGTFMPVLIAMAFMQTSLVLGLLGFVLIVGVGLLIRSYLSRLNLLLVARISAVIISVIVIIAVFSVLSFQVGLSEGLKITFFPMIILSWTIERMSILWEEEGAKEVLVQGGGSLLVALIAYGVMNNEWVRHITFNFLGLQFILMALVLLLGSYTGYRLLELRRFRPLLERQD